LRDRRVRLRSSINYYEELSTTQAEELSKLNKPRDFTGPTAGEDEGEDDNDEEEIFSQEDLRREEQEIQELERKKRTLENRVAGIEKDLNF
jgi:hypothetical protein